MTGTETRVSIIIPTRDRAPLLKRALESVRDQTFEDWEAIVVNDDSKDNTVEVVKAFADPRIRLTNFKSGGVIAAVRNEGIRHARGEFIAFLDSDDRWFPEKLEKCLRAMTDRIDLVGHGLVYVRQGKVWKTKLSGPQKNATYESMLYHGNCSLTTSAVLVKRECLQKVSGFIEDPVEVVDPRRFQKLVGGRTELTHVGAEDYDLWLRLAKNGTRFAFVDEFLGEYHLHDNNAGKETSSIVRSQLVVLERHFAMVESHSILERLRQNRRRALVFYMAARTLQDEGLTTAALKMYLRTFSIYPLVWKLYPAVLVTLCEWPWRSAPTE